MAPDVVKYLESKLGKVSDDEKVEIAKSISSGSSPSNGFFIMLTISAVIATVGLITNSVAAIIGAMLVSPLLTPVIGTSLGAVKGDLKLFWQAMEAEAKGAGLVLLLAIIITLLIPSATIGSEILLRTKPTPLDLIIALASGAAGAYALTKKDIGATLPGVAIAVAMLPPLCVVGIGFAMRDIVVALGGALTFLANVVAINFAASMVFWIIGFRQDVSLKKMDEAASKIKTSAFLLLLISLPLAYIMWQSISESDTHLAIQQTLGHQMEGIPFARLESFSFERLGSGAIGITAIIESPKPLSQEKTDEMRVALEKRLKSDVELNIIVQQVDVVSSASAVGK